MHAIEVSPLLASVAAPPSFRRVALLVSPTGATSGKLMMEMADAMVDLGLKDVGYEYVNTDDLWLEAERGADGRLVPKKAFADGDEGMRNLSSYIHSKGLKFGIYGAAGETLGSRM